MVCVQESYLRCNVFTNFLPRNAYMSHYVLSTVKYWTDQDVIVNDVICFD
jgi:hypothetical protein